MRKITWALITVLLLGVKTIKAQEQTLSASEPISSGCLSQTRGTEAPIFPTIKLTKEGDMLSVDLLNYSSNCGTRDFEVENRLYDGNSDNPSVVISVTPVIPAEADCICPFNISYTVRGLEKNSFYLTCWWYDGPVELTEGEPLVLEYDIKYAVLDGLTYRLLKTTHQAQLIYQGIWNNKVERLQIPSEIEYGELKYTVTSIDESVFSSNTNIKEIIIPKTVKNTEFGSLEGITSNPFSGCLSLETIEVEEGNPAICSVDGVLFNKDKTNLLCYPTASPRELYTVPDGVKRLSTGAFFNNRHLKKIVLPDNLESLGYSVFANSKSLEEVILPSNIKELPFSLFKNCTKLKDIYYHSKTVPITGADVFGGVDLSQITLHVPAKSIDSYKSSIPWNQFGAIVPLETQTNVDQRESLYGEWWLVGWNDGENWFEVDTNYVSHQHLSIEIPKEGYVMAYSMVNEIFVGLLTLNGNEMIFDGEMRGFSTEAYCTIMENLFFEDHISDIKSYQLEGKLLKLYYTDDDYFVFTKDFDDSEERYYEWKDGPADPYIGEVTAIKDGEVEVKIIHSPSNVYQYSRTMPPTSDICRFVRSDLADQSFEVGDRIAFRIVQFKRLKVEERKEYQLKVEPYKSSEYVVNRTGTMHNDRRMGWIIIDDEVNERQGSIYYYPLKKMSEEYLIEGKSVTFSGEILPTWRTPWDNKGHSDCYYLSMDAFTGYVTDDDYRPFVEEGKVWKLGGTSENPVQWVEYYYFDGDTIIDGKVCKQMMCQRYYGPDYQDDDCITIPIPDLRYVGAWYEEDKKVYYYTINNQLKMMYDFSLEANDTLLVDNEYQFVVGPKQTGGLKGFKDVYRDIMWYWSESGSSSYSTTWLEGVGSIDGPTNNVFFSSVKRSPLLMSCVVGDEVIYLNDEYEDGATPAEARKRRFDFSHTIKTKPKARRQSGEEQSLYGEYNDQQLGINLDPLDDAYQVRITDESGKFVYEKVVNAGNIVGLNIDISAYAKGRYTVTVENSQESFTGQFETQATGIEAIRNNKEEKGIHIYNLQGQRLNSLQKGLNIVNGRKVYVK
jgi:hypothetical protein